MSSTALSAWIPVRVEPSPLGLGYCVVSPSLAEKLLTTHRETFEAEARSTRWGDETLTRDVPQARPDQLEHLDEHGLIRVGSAVVGGDILVGRTAPSAGTPPSSEEKLLNALFGEKSGDRDTSVRASPGLRGTVTQARCESGRAFVEVSWSRPLDLGDVLIDLDGHRAVVAAIQDGEADLRFGRAAGATEVAKVAIAADALFARSIGPYSLVTQRPLGGKLAFGGQPVSAGLIAALVEAGNPWAAWELMTLKSDCVGGRTWAYESLVRGDHPTPNGPVNDLFGLNEPQRQGLTAPESVLVAERELLALGFSTTIDGGAARGAWLTSEEVRARSHGRVTKPNTIDEKTLACVPGGLFCQRIFGPVKDFRCACGKHTGPKSRGLVCDVCGVEVTRSAVRRERFGHIELPVPVPHPWRADLLLDALPVLPADLRPIVPLDDGRWATSDLNDLYAEVIVRSNRIRKLSELNTRGSILQRETGGLIAAVRALFDNAAQPTPIVYGGRPLRSLRGTLEGHLGPDLIAKRVDYSGLANLVANPDLPEDTCYLPRTLAHELFKPWVYGLTEARGYVSTIRAAKRGLESNLPWALAALEDVAAHWPVFLATDRGVAARRVLLWDAPAIGVSPATAEALAAEQVVVHVPLTEPAVRRARAADDRVHPIGSVRPATTSRGWLSEIMAGGDVPKALARAGEGEVDHVDDPLFRLGLGCWPEGPQAESVSWQTPDLVGPLPDREALRAAHQLRSIDDLALSEGVVAALKAAGILTVGALSRTSDAELLKTVRIRRPQLREIQDALGLLGLPPR